VRSVEKVTEPSGNSSHRHTFPRRLKSVRSPDMPTIADRDHTYRLRCTDPLTTSLSRPGGRSLHALIEQPV
jgi:hypothetical protein